MKLIYIGASAQRSGTNFLARILIEHPSVSRPHGHWEWPGLYFSEELKSYSSKLDNRFKKKRKDLPFNANKKIFQFLGEGYQREFEDVIVDKDAEFIVHKFPGAVGLENVFRFFPEARLIVLLRNGKDNVDSFYRAATYDKKGLSKLKKFAASCLVWRNNIKSIYSFLNNNEKDVLVVDYDRLNKDSYKESLKVLKFNNLKEPENWKNTIENIGVKGSSFYKEGEESSNLKSTNWKIEKKTKAFNPNERWRSNWGILERIMYSLICSGADKMFDQITSNSLEK